MTGAEPFVFLYFYAKKGLLKDENDTNKGSRRV